MTGRDSVLIVEDEPDWQRIYQTVARRQGITSIASANDLATAKEILSRQEFAVAFVDVGLDVDDDSNIDGLKVMELIRALGDETSIIVVTGRSGHDVVPITRDALRKYQAFDAIGKVPAEPEELQRLMTDGLHAFRATAQLRRRGVRDVLRGDNDPQIWDYELLRALKVKGGVEAFYGFLENLLGRFQPIVGRSGTALVEREPESTIAHGTFWSRAAGQAVAVAFGSKAELTNEGDAVTPLTGLDLGDLLHSVSAGELVGYVYALPHDTRDVYLPSPLNA